MNSFVTPGPLTTPVLFIAFNFLIVNLIVDLVQLRLDPRLRHP